MIDLDLHRSAIVAGDADAFARWLAGAEPEVRRSLARFAADVDAEVVLQEALLRVWQFAPRVQADGRPNTLLRYALVVARNLAVDELRRTRRTEAIDDVSELPAPEVVPSDPALRRWIRVCIERLPAQPRAALEARLASAGGAPDADLADAVGMRLNTFLKNVGRARTLLADCLAGHGVRVGGGA